MKNKTKKIVKPSKKPVKAQKEEKVPLRKEEKEAFVDSRLSELSRSMLGENEA